MTRSAVFLAAALMGAALAVTLVLAAPALAGQAVELRADVANHDGRVTLGDLFADPGDVGDVLVAWGGVPGRDFVLNAGRVQAAAQAHGLDWANAQGLRQVIARAARGPVAPGGASRARVSEALVYARDFAAGDVVRAEDLVWSKSADLLVPIDAPRDARAVIGQAARRPLRAGSAVSAKDVAAAQVIKTNDLVSVAYQADGIKLVLQGRAMGPAVAGQAFSVMNPGSKKEIQAIATGPGEAIVGPQADRLRLALQSDPTLLATLR